MKVINRRNFFIAIILLCTSLCFAHEPQERKFFGFQFAVGGTIPLYGDGAQWDNHAEMSDNHFARIVIGSDVGFTLKLADPLFFVFDFETCSDFGWDSSYHSNSLDYAFAAGFQFYPGWGNLSFILAYALGGRSDFVKLPDEYSKIKNTKWGNGFKLAVEYDFFEGGGFIPGVGLSYRLMPRGYSNYDNIINIYVRFAFR
ncbi:MAG: hypothetical protein J6Y36_00250 [Treponema sp.]|nr:hypothetical protein [Treponema sp.]